jgi:hypothetical protein
MYTESQRISGAVEEMTAAACVELFAAYDVPLAPVLHSDWGNTDEALYSAVIGFVSPQIRGTCLLACETNAVQKSCPPGGRIRDWIGELSNQLIGRLKVKLLGHDIEIGLTTPIVLQGIRLRPLPKSALLPAVFSSEWGTVLVWVEAEVTAGFSLPPARIPDAGETGDLMFF